MYIIARHHDTARHDHAAQRPSSSSTCRGVAASPWNATPVDQPSPPSPRSSNNRRHNVVQTNSQLSLRLANSSILIRRSVISTNRPQRQRLIKQPNRHRPIPQLPHNIQRPIPRGITRQHIINHNIRVTRRRMTQAFTQTRKYRLIRQTLPPTPMTKGQHNNVRKSRSRLNLTTTRHRNTTQRRQHTQPSLIVSQAPRLNHKPSTITMSAIQQQGLQVQRVTISTHLIRLLSRVIHHLLRHRRFSTLVPRSISSNLHIHVTFMSIRNRRTNSRITNIHPNQYRNHISNHQRLHKHTRRQPLPPRLRTSTNRHRRRNSPTTQSSQRCRHRRNRGRRPQHHKCSRKSMQRHLRILKRRTRSTTHRYRDNRCSQRSTGRAITSTT